MALHLSWLWPSGHNFMVLMHKYFGTWCDDCFYVQMSLLAFDSMTICGSLRFVCRFHVAPGVGFSWPTEQVSATLNGYVGTVGPEFNAFSLFQRDETN